MTAIVEVSNLKKHFPIKRSALTRSKAGFVHAVDGISFKIKEGEIFGLVGESGCGKTTTGKMIVDLLEPTEGEIWFQGKNMNDVDKSDAKYIKKNMQMIFQDPLASLNPRKKIREIVSLPYKVHEKFEKNDVEEKIRKLLEQVELKPPESFLERYPHELSGGQRQRVGLARAIALNPSFVVADEPVSALDVSCRGHILNLMNHLNKSMGIAYLLITHDLAVIRSFAQKVAVMYLGKIVEICDADKLYSNPLHPYTLALLHATPIVNPEKKRTTKLLLEGDVPSPIDLPTGCRFHPRCPFSHPECSREEPQMKEVEKDHFVSCFFYDSEEVSKSRNQIRTTLLG
jgi:oligopeptide/dipeptide ABC transporter ATP-binding protein